MVRKGVDLPEAVFAFMGTVFEDGDVVSIACTFAPVMVPSRNNASMAVSRLCWRLKLGISIGSLSTSAPQQGRQICAVVWSVVRLQTSLSRGIHVDPHTPPRKDWEGREKLTTGPQRHPPHHRSLTPDRRPYSYLHRLRMGILLHLSALR